MLRCLSNLTSAGNGVLGSHLVGVLASDIPSTGDAGPSLLYNDIAQGDPAGCYYRVEITAWPSAGVLSVDEAGAFSFTGAADGAYSATGRVDKFNPASGLFYSDTAAISLTIGSGGVVTPPSPTVTSVTVSPSTATGSTLFVAVVNGANSPSQAVTWSANGGSINASGAFVAPSQTYSVQTITVTATSVADPSKSGAATVTIAALPPRVTPNPVASLRRGRARGHKRR